MSKENYKNYFNGGCSTCMFAKRDEKGRYIGSCSGFSNCSYEEYKGETDITEEEKDQKIADLEAKLAESKNDYLLLEEQLENANEWSKDFQEENEQLKQQLIDIKKEHLLDEKEYKNYCAFKTIEPQIKGCLDREIEYKKQLVEKETRIAELEDKDWYEATIKQLEEQNERLIKERDGNYENYSICWKDNEYLKQQLAEKEKQIADLEDWQNWYSMWHNKFRKQIVNLQTELETYRPTKLKGNGQCICYGCEQKGEFGRFWTDWCSKYKGHIYCDKCLKELLEKEKNI